MNISNVLIKKIKWVITTYVPQLKELCLRINRLLPVPVFSMILMTKGERGLFLKTVKKSGAYLEFGIGGSTIAVLKHTKAHIYSVESSQEWIGKIQSFVIVQKALQKSRLTIHHIDIGVTHGFGYPLGEQSCKKFPNYSGEIFEKYDLQEVDTVLVDGRFRVACVLQSILHLRDDIIIMVHDFSERPAYHIILKYVEVIDRVESLAVFKIKSEINREEVKCDIEKYQYDPL